MPWIHFHSSYNGKVQTCCVGNIPFGNINESTLEEIWEGDAIKETRAQFLKGEADNRCAACLNVEKAGGKSIRQETFERYPDEHPNSIESDLPYYFDIRFSNLCNFRCRTCWHGYSSKWFNEAKEFGNTAGKSALIKNINDFEHFIQQTEKGLKNAKEIYFAGGEPLITEEHYLLLEWLIENGNTNIHLRYNTNCSEIKLKDWNVLDIWKKFSKITIQASIDGTEKIGEYIRKEMNWEQVKSNLEKMKELDQLDLILTPTASILNIEHIPHLYQSLVNEDIIEKEALNINLLERPFHYNTKAIPAQAKKRITQQFNQIKIEVPESIKQQFKECIAFMNDEQLHEKHWNKFVQINGKLDEMRNENLNDYLSFD